MYLVNLQKCILCICHGCYPTDLSVIAPPPPSGGFLCHLTLLLIIIIFNILTIINILTVIIIFNILTVISTMIVNLCTNMRMRMMGRMGRLGNRRLVTC